MTRRIGIVTAAVGCGALLLSACGGTSSSPPTSPTTTPAPADPAVTITLTYTCHPCTTDPDNYSLWVEGKGSVQRLPGTTAETSTLTWTGTLAPGAHKIEVTIVNAETSWSLTYGQPSMSGNTGGIKPNTFRLISGESKYDVRTVGRCGVSTTFSARPPILYELLFETDVVLGTAPNVC